MFRVPPKDVGQPYRLAVIVLLLLSAVSLAITIWVEVDFVREQEIVRQLIRKLPSDSTASAEALAGELRWQFRLTTLVVLNLVVTGFAVVLLWRAYRASQDSLRDVKALAGDILSSMDQAVITTDLEGKITSINKRGLELLAPESECVGQPLKALPAVALHDFRNDWMVARSVAMTRDFQTTHDGAGRTLRAFCQTLNDYEGNEIGNVLQLRDVSKRVLIEDQVRRMERYMGLGSLAAGLHHEIKNPLAALSLHVQLLEEQLEDDNSSDEIRQMFGIIKSEVARIGGVLEGFRDFAAIGQLNIAPLDLVDLVTRQVELVKPRASQLKIGISIDSSNFFGEISADRVRLEQVLLNLIVNAMEAMPNGGMLTILLSVTDRVANIQLKDTGCGIPENLYDKILDPYFTTKGEGTGLGLAICDKIMRQHQGSLEFQSSPNGTTVQLSLPTTLKSKLTG